MKKVRLFDRDFFTRTKIPDKLVRFANPYPNGFFPSRSLPRRGGSPFKVVLLATEIGEAERKGAKHSLPLAGKKIPGVGRDNYCALHRPAGADADLHQAARTGAIRKRTDKLLHLSVLYSL